jgi:PHD/YefM family antitoxin component YafN of YafNO toxin-antitoxin module
MTRQPPLIEPEHVDEPQGVQEYADILSRVASNRQPVIVRRSGADFAVVIALEHLELLQELLAQREAERIASQVDWAQLAKESPPPPQWFEGEEPKPF